MQTYKDLIVWQKSMDLVVVVYQLSRELPRSEQFGLSSQTQRAVVSIPANIAEGYGRKNRGEYRQFLSIAFGSSLELETHLLLIQRLYPHIDVHGALELLEEVQKMLGALSRKLTPTP